MPSMFKNLILLGVCVSTFSSISMAVECPQSTTYTNGQWSSTSPWDQVDTSKTTPSSGETYSFNLASAFTLPGQTSGNAYCQMKSNNDGSILKLTSSTFKPEHLVEDGGWMCQGNGPGGTDEYVCTCQSNLADNCAFE